MRKHDPLRGILAAFALLLAPCAYAAVELDRPPDAAAERARALKRAIDEIVARTPLHASRAGILVSSLDSGQVLYARDADVLLNPASNVKLFTSAAVLSRLGPEYRFDTEVYVDAPAQGGQVKTLYVKGKGDPTFVTERLWALAGDIAHRGVKVVKGDLVMDDTFFDGERDGPGYDQERGDRSYLAPVGALSLNFNTVAIHVAPGNRAGEKARVELEPASDFFQVENRAVTVKPNARRRVAPASIPLPQGRQRIVVDARLPVGSRDQVFWRKIDDPPAYFGHTLKRLLELRGVKVTGTVRRAAVPDGARLLCAAESEALGEIVRKLDKTSNNFVAEQLLKTLGAEKKGRPGTWPKGVEAVEDFLADLGLARGTYVMKNGSGLNDTNRFSARQAVVLLREMWKRFPAMPDFVAALPVAGKDGTTRWRMQGTEGRLRAKTGTLESVTCLSGYVETAAHERLVFSVIVNDFPGRSHLVVRAVDAVGNALAAAGGADLGAAVASATPPPTEEASVADVKAHLATYYQLGRSADRRNVSFLRTAFSTERDPVLRIAAAEAIYLSDPDSPAGRRAFLEALAADGESFTRLRSLELRHDANAPTPVLGSLADLASEGHPGALARLVEISPAALADPTVADAVAELWYEVARDAPEDLVRALAAAPGAAADGATTAIARGFARSKDQDEPFSVALKRAEVDADPQVAGYAHTLRARFGEQVAAARAVLQAGPAATIGPAAAPAAADMKPPEPRKTEG
jgi:serine-type D-Ala-D-Ala carboxypeptidase/endopeptidase (penicillin-binding protein 4)